MSVLFPSEEWVLEVREKLNANPAYQKAAGKWEGTFVFHILPEENLLDEEFILWTDPWHGQMRSAKRLSSLDDETVNYGLVGKYSVWKKVIMGNLDSTKAMMTGKLKVSGKMSYLLRNKKAADVIVSTLKGMDVKFIDD